MSDTPLHTAHQHAANADEAHAQSHLVRAAEEHQKASEAYGIAHERATEDQVKRTLKLLQDDHSRSAKEIERQVAKLRTEGKDPNVPQPTMPSIARGSRNPKAPSSPAGASGLGAGGVTDLASNLASQRAANMNDSNYAVDESFMVLAGTRSDPSDLFNKFWEVTQGMLDNLSQPVAFATAPLTTVAESSPSSSASKLPESVTQRRLPKEGSLSSDTDMDEPVVSWVTKRLGFGQTTKNKTSYPPTSSLSKDEIKDIEFDDDDLDPDGLSESFLLIPSGSESATSLKKENVSLKKDVESLQAKLAAAERMLQLRDERDQQLKDSIVLARREAQRGQAQRAMNASAVVQRSTAMPGGLDLNALNINVPSPTSMNPGREAQYTRRIRELEDELRTAKGEVKTLQGELEKQKLMIAKYKERWDKLKESSKKKKEARAAAAATDLTKERIAEEPEDEQLA